MHVQTEISGHDISNLQNAANIQVKELVNIKEKILQLPLTEQSFEKDEEKCKYYSGLPNFSVLFSILFVRMCHIFLKISCPNFKNSY